MGIRASSLTAWHLNVLPLPLTDVNYHPTDSPRSLANAALLTIRCQQQSCNSSHVIGRIYGKSKPRVLSHRRFTAFH